MAVLDLEPGVLPPNLMAVLDLEPGVLPPSLNLMAVLELEPGATMCCYVVVTLSQGDRAATDMPSSRPHNKPLSQEALSLTRLVLRVGETIGIAR